MIIRFKYRLFYWRSWEWPLFLVVPADLDRACVAVRVGSVGRECGVFKLSFQYWLRMVSRRFSHNLIY